MNVKPCPNCNTLNVIAICSNCGKAFVIITSHLEHQPREYGSHAIKELPADFVIPVCDNCDAKAKGDLFGAVGKGLRQRTCPECHSEFLSHYGL